MQPRFRPPDPRRPRHREDRGAYLRRGIKASQLTRERSLEIREQAAEVALRAGRRAGELLGQMEKAKPGPAAAPKPAKPAVKPEPRQDPSRDARDLEAPTLGELGITYSESSRLQALASLPAPAFEAHISDVKAKGEELTTAGALREAARV